MYIEQVGLPCSSLLRYQILSQLCSELTRLTRGNPLEIAELVSRFGVSDTENWEPKKIQKTCVSKEFLVFHHETPVQILHLVTLYATVKNFKHRMVKL